MECVVPESSGRELLIAFTCTALIWVLATIVLGHLIGVWVLWALLGVAVAWGIASGKLEWAASAVVAAAVTLSVTRPFALTGYRLWPGLIAIAGLAAFFVRRRWHSLIWRPMCAWCALLGLYGLSIAWGPDAYRGHSSYTLLHWSGCAGGFLLCAGAASTNERVQRSLLQVVWLFASAGSVILLWRGWGRMDLSLLRVGIDANGAGYLAFWAILGSVFMSGKTVRWLMLAGSSLAIGMSVLVASASRGAILVTAVCIVAFVLLSSGRRTSILLTLAAATLLSGSVLVSSRHSAYAVQRYHRVLETGAVDRLQHVVVGARMAVSEPVGGGAGYFKQNFGPYAKELEIETKHEHVSPHSVLALVLADLGFPGLFILCYLVYSAAKGVLVAPKRNAEAITVLLAMLLLASTSNFSIVAWALVGCGVGVSVAPKVDTAIEG